MTALDGYSVKCTNVLWSDLGEGVTHRTNRSLNHHLEQDPRGNTQRIHSMWGFKSDVSAARFCRGYEETRHFLRARSPTHFYTVRRATTIGFASLPTIRMKMELAIRRSSIEVRGGPLRATPITPRGEVRLFSSSRQRYSNESAHNKSRMG